MADPRSSGSKRETTDGNEAPKPEKKERPQVHYPEILWGSKLRIVILCNIPSRYKVPENPFEVRFLYAKCHEGPDSLGVFPREDSGDSTVWFTIHRKTEKDKTHRVVFEGTGSDSVDMIGRTVGSWFVINGPDFEMLVVAEPKPAAVAPISSETQSQLAAIAKEREIIAKVLSIRKEYEETVLPNLPASIQITGYMLLSLVSAPITMELRKGRLDKAENELRNQRSYDL